MRSATTGCGASAESVPSGAGQRAPEVLGTLRSSGSRPELRWRIARAERAGTFCIPRRTNWPRPDAKGFEALYALRKEFVPADFTESQRRELRALAVQNVPALVPAGRSCGRRQQGGHHAGDPSG
jgi:hypothetical protein